MSRELYSFLLYFLPYSILLYNDYIHRKLSCQIVLRLNLTLSPNEFLVYLLLIRLISKCMQYSMTWKIISVYPN